MANHREHRGHRIELRTRQAGPADSERGATDDAGQDVDLLIDGRQVSHGRLPDGQYFLYEYAYDWSDDLMELASRLVDHRAAANRIRAGLSRSERD